MPRAHGIAHACRKHTVLWGSTYASVNPARILLDEVPGWQIGPVIQQQAEPLGCLLAMLGAAGFTKTA